jgi:hypothetical protein
MFHRKAAPLAAGGGIVNLCRKRAAKSESRRQPDHQCENRQSHDETAHHPSNVVDQLLTLAVLALALFPDPAIADRGLIDLLFGHAGQSPRFSRASPPVATDT